MNNLKVKTFMFEDDCLFKFNRNYYDDTRRDGEYKYKHNTYLIDNNINTFLTYNNVEIVDIKVNSVVVGNNPPTSVLMYTIIYKELDD